MAIVCLKSKFGYCKFGSRCENIHYEEVCENNVQLCIGKLCEKRHPVFCKFFQQFGRCKFTQFCAYRHSYKKENKIENKMDEVKSELKDLKSVIERNVNELKSEIKDLKSEVAALKTEKTELQTKLEMIENKHQNSDKCENNQSTSLKSLENESTENEQKSLDEIICENSIEKKVYKCDKCDIEKSNKKELLIHKDKWHTQYYRYGFYRRLRMVCNGGDGFDWECSLCLAHYNGDCLKHLRDSHTYLGEEILTKGYFEETD